MFIKICDIIAFMFFVLLSIPLILIAVTMCSISISIPIVIGTTIGLLVLSYYFTKWIFRDIFLMLISIIPGILYGVPRYFCDGIDELSPHCNVVCMFLYPCYRAVIGIVMGPIDYYNFMRLKLCRPKR